MNSPQPRLQPGTARFPILRRKLLLTLLVLSGVILVNLLLAMFFFRGPTPKLKFETADGCVFLPGSERPLDALVVGVNPDTALYFYLPEIREGTIQNPDKDRDVREQLFWLRLELVHGQIFNAIPDSTIVYAALPDPKRVKGSHGWEEGWLTDYLETRCHWTKEDIKRRLYFFKTRSPLVWTQDAGKIFGKDKQGRRVIFTGPQDQATYLQFVRDLCLAYPKDFVEHVLPSGLSAEGGDEDLVRTPDGVITLLLGRHRVLRYVELAYGSSALAGQGLSDGQIDQAQSAYSSGLDGLPAIAIPQKVLLDPTLGTDELFHLDMSTAVVGNGIGNHAFVPTYIDHPIDRMTGLPLDPGFVKSLQSEFDIIASQLADMGFHVARLKIEGHPVRSPVNLVRFYDPATGRCKVLLAKYPLQDADNENNTQKVLMARIGDLKTGISQWEKKPDMKSYLSVKSLIQSVWSVMDRVPVESSPIFEYNAKKFRDAGIDVVPVADFAWGAGGLHCQVLK
jgi:hypothetical protein